MMYSRILIRGAFQITPYCRPLSLHPQSYVILRSFHTPRKAGILTSNVVYQSPLYLGTINFSTEVEPKDKETKTIVEADPKKQKKTIWQKIKHEVLHFYNGFKLLGVEIRIAIGICFRILRGNSLTRRERNQLVRTTADIFRLIPFSVFVIVPFMEFLLPLYIKFFPFMMPSTFKEQKKEEIALKQQFLGKLEMAKFLQETLNKNIASKSETSDNTVEEFTEFLRDVRESGKMPDTRDIIRFSRLFEDNITLESLDQKTLTALCKLLDLTAIGPKDFLLFQLHMRVRQLKAQDQMIKSEGIDSIPAFELQSLCRERGMRSVGLTEERLRQQLKQWLILQLDQKVPISLLLLSRAMYVQDTTLPPAKQLQLAISKITDGASSEATLAIDSIDAKTKIEALRQEQKLIKEERKAKKIADSKDAAAQEKEKVPKKSEELADPAEVIYQSSGTTPEQLAKEKEELKVKLEEFLTKEDLSEISNAVHIIQKQSNLGIVDEAINEMKEDLEEAYERQLKIKGCDSKVDPEVLNRLENLSRIEESIKVTPEESGDKSNKALTARVDKLLTEIDKMMSQLTSQKESVVKNLERDRLKFAESKDPSDLEAKIQTEEQALVDMEQVLSALNKITKPDKRSKMERFLAVLDEDKDGKIETGHIVSLIEMLEKSDMNISEKELKKIIEMIDTEKELDLKKSQETKS